MDYADECFFSLLRLTELIGQYSFRMCLLIVGSDVQIMLMLSHCNKQCISQTESTLGRKDYMKVRQSSEGRAYTEVMWLIIAYQVSTHADYALKTRK